MKINQYVREDIAARFVLLVLLILCSYWIFIDTYRVNAFHIVPHDDYAPYLLYLIGEEGGRMQGSPFVYRLLSVVAAIPFFYVLPVYKFTLLENVDMTYLRAVEALAMVSYISLLGICGMVYSIITKRYGGTPSAGAIGSLGMLLLMQFSGYKGIDPIGILLVCILIYYSRNIYLFAVIIAVSVGFNEKISLVTSIVMVSRFIVFRDRKMLPQAAISAAAFVGYLLIRTILHVPGNEQQMQVYNFLGTAWANVLAIFTLKRIVLELVPVSTLLIFYALAMKEYRTNVQQYSKYFLPSDVFGILGLFAVMMAVGIHYNVGRIIMFSAPFYVPLAAIGIEKMLQRRPGNVAITQ